jgi:transcriptional regulator with GAF, ATPase, and Fis domain
MIYRALSAGLWREVARHGDIAETSAALLALLRAVSPVDWLLVRSWDAERSRLDTVAQVGDPPAAERRTSLPTPRREGLLAWAGRGVAESWPGREVTGIARSCAPEGLSGPLVGGPLVEDGVLVGVIVAGAPPETLPALHEAIEPFAVALRNDARRHELAALREAAEQDRSALLSRLARQDVSDAVVGAERGLREVMARVAQVAPTDAPVLILGETGAGKEVVARAIHAQSRRERGPFLRVNCGAIPTELVDSELFGHEKGSFTGAISQRKGWFERADGGTLFLDEVGELPAAAQVRLLRVLQDGTFQRVGGQESHTVDVRIVAATHRDMAGLMRDGRFRQDLWYRVSVFPIQLPALRERRGDIPALARHFAERAGVRLFGRSIPLGADEMEQLVAYDWPGNVRELAAVIERAAILGNGQRLSIGPALGVGPRMSGGGGATAPGDERSEIEAALRTSRGRIEGPFGAAAALGVNPHTLRSRLRRLGIDWSAFRGGG